MMSTAAQPVWDIMFQVAVPKVSLLLLASFFEVFSNGDHF
jgi:hypothetical protein